MPDMVAGNLDVVELLKTMPSLPKKALLSETGYGFPKPPGHVGALSGVGTLLHLACYKGDAKLARHLLEIEGMSLGSEIASVGNALHVASSCGHADVVGYLLSRPDGRVLVNQSVGSYGNESPLQLAAAAGSSDCVRALVAAGADLDYVDGTGHRDTALSRALRRGNLATAQWMLSSYGKRDVYLDDEGKKSIFNCFGRSPPCPDTLRFVIEDVGIPASHTEAGWNFIMKVVYGEVGEVDQQAVLRWMQQAVELGVSPSQPNASGKTPATKAREFGLDEVAAYLERVTEEQGGNGKRQKM